MVELGAFVLNTPDPPSLAAFYADLLGWLPVEGDADPAFVRLRAPARERPGLSFQLDGDVVVATWPPRPGAPRMQAHVDVLVEDLDAEVARAVSLGATEEEHQPSEGVRVMRDPHGHVFCLFLPGY